MITGERRLYAHGSADYPAEHCAFTVEMMSVADQREVCVIDEIQMLRDNYRGASWTRALLGAAVKEIHLCGEEAAVEIVQRLLDPIGEHVDVRRYQRKGDLLVINTHGLRDLSNVEVYNKVF
jgi:ATP-dependent RNA helicase SUPV3L1/SUV3